MTETTATRRRDSRVTVRPEIPERAAESETERRELIAKKETDLGVLDGTIERNLGIFGDDRTRWFSGRGRSLGFWLVDAKLQRRLRELTQTTPDQPVDDEEVYYKLAGECPKGRVYGLGSLGIKKRRYADVDASTS
ncbi:hypothetical protein Syun_016693 [Stephania yunnanensis]|uniref:Uncharacterized protein n=1 Tax=Stephania yunnanensis TaxID=152371 RepID=A0AAP0J5D8_9MAGN